MPWADGCRRKRLIPVFRGFANRKNRNSRCGKKMPRLNCYNLELIKRPHFDILVGMESKISVEFRINGGK